jgi:pSer/pThr/pTyr-binding forkhead associated (FHA) protein
MTQRTANTKEEHYLIIQDNRGRRELLLTENTYTLGRSANCDIIIKSQFVSRHHATLLRHQREDNSFYYEIIDGNGADKISANGLLFNSKKIFQHNLRSGDEIIFGPQISIVYQYRQRNEFLSFPGNDPFDITLIDPSMMDDDIPTLMPTTRTQDNPI